MVRSIWTTVAIGALVVAGPAGAIGTQATQQPLPVQTTSASAQTTSGQAQETAAKPRTGGLLGGIFGCAADGSTQGIGAAIGGAAGGLLGNRIAGRGSRTLGTILGAAVGAAAGSAIGCKLQQNDRDRAERAAEKALETGENQSWANAETGAAGQVTVGDTAAGGSLGDLRFASGVEPAGGFVKVGESFTTRSATNLRAGPGTKAAVRATLPAGQRLWVPAQVKGQPWMLVAENGVGQGYVSAPLLTRTASAAAANCKLVTQTVSLPGEAEQAETYQACKGNDGAWTMTRV